MDDLEKAFQTYLTQLVDNRRAAEVRVKLIRDFLVPQFISDEYPLSKLSADIARMVLDYRRRRLLLRVGSGVYNYYPGGVPAEDAEFEVPPAFGRTNRLVVDRFAGNPAAPLPDSVRTTAFDSVATLARSGEFLVSSDLKNADFKLLEGLSF